MKIFILTLSVFSLAVFPSFANAQSVPAQQALACESLLDGRNLTLTYARIRTAENGTGYCYVRGIIHPAIHYHVQLPLPENWNGFSKTAVQEI